MEKIKVSAVSYLNTKPFLYGLERSAVLEQIDLSLDIPSEGARKLAAGEVDLGLVPVAVLPQLQSPTVITDFCIGTTGAVKTVCIYSQVPLHDIQQLYLDHHSRTSVQLVRILLEGYWHHQPELIAAQPGFEQHIEGSTAALIIGDRAIEWGPRFAYEYDLGSAWVDHTGLPFVFAVWLAMRPLSEQFLEQFNEALQLGVNSIQQTPQLYADSPFPGFDLRHYLTQHISFNLDSQKRAGMDLFLSKLATLNAV